MAICRTIGDDIPMKILLIGGNGFIGTGISRYFVERGHAITSIARQSKSSVSGVESIAGDRQNAADFERALAGRSFDIAVDITAYQRPDVETILPVVKRTVRHYFLISTDFVYHNDLQLFPIHEDAPKDPDSPYGQGKLACEALLSAEHAARTFPFTALRLPHVIGAGKELGGGSVQGRDRNLLRSMRSGTGLTLIADGTLLIAPVWHRQVAAAIEACALKPSTYGQIMNCTGGDLVTTRHYYSIIADLLQVPLRYDAIGLDEARRKHSHLRPFARHRFNDLSRLKTLANFEPGSHLREALAETVHWMDEHC